MPNGTAEDERLGYIFHFDRGLDPGLDSDLLELCFVTRER